MKPVNQLKGVGRSIDSALNLRCLFVVGQPEVARRVPMTWTWPPTFL